MKFADEGSTHFLPTPEPAPGLPPAVTAQDALGDLPPITLHLKGLLKKGPRRFDTLIQYDDSRPATDYARMMRTWPGFGNNDGICDHVIRYLPRDYPIFARMDAGNQYPEAHEHAKQLFQEKLNALDANGKRPAEGTEEYEKLWKETVPPYDPGKFPNKWRKMEAEMPARTLMAHLGKDSYSHIHYDSKQARTISVREAARLQSFPDGFVFQGPMNPGFRQVGNAVPPLMARALAQHMMQTLRG
jgi:DNA (cytosine-5)-methyltransferase 1